MEFHVWSGMISRCCDPRAKHYERYGGRGISVCERWRNSYEAFIEDMGKRPKGLTLERIDNNGNYEPGNCKWATRREQANNTSANHVLECRGESMTMAQWCDKLGMGRSTLSARVGSGRSVEDALFGKLRPPLGVVVECRGESMNIKQWAAKIGMPPATLGSRLKRGKGVEWALFGKVQQHRPARICAPKS